MYKRSICGGICCHPGAKTSLSSQAAYRQSLPGISHSCLLVKRHNNNHKTRFYGLGWVRVRVSFGAIIVTFD